MHQQKTLKDIKNHSLKEKTLEADPLNLYTLEAIDEYDQAKLFVGDRFETYYAKQWGMEEPVDNVFISPPVESSESQTESLNPVWHMKMEEVSPHLSRSGRWGANKSAFLFGYFWFAYRKMYGYAAVLFIFTTCSTYVSFGWSILISFLLMVCGGLFANRLYYGFMNKHLKKINTLIFTNETHKRQRIAQTGGTSKVAVFIAIVLTIASMIPLLNQLNHQMTELMNDQTSGDILQQVDQM